MSNLIHISKEYRQWIQSLSQRFRRSQIKASVKVNQEMLRYYWDLGRDIVARDAENVYGHMPTIEEIENELNETND